MFQKKMELRVWRGEEGGGGGGGEEWQGSDRESRVVKEKVVCFCFFFCIFFV